MEKQQNLDSVRPIILFQLTENQITQGLKHAVSREKGATLQVLEYLKEVERRKLYAVYAYSSLFEYAVKELKYSEAQASERINSMRLLNDLPEIKDMLKTGALSITTASQIQRFIRNEKRFANESLTEAQKKNIVNLCANQSKREVEKILFNFQSDEVKHEIGERIRRVSETHLELKFRVPDGLMKQVEAVRNMVGESSLSQIFSEALNVYVAELKKKYECEKKLSEEVARPDVSSTPQSSKRRFEMPARHSRYIPRTMKRMLYARSGGQCEFVDPETKNRCLSHYRIQIDHIVPYAYGGLTEIGNLRHLCKNHNLRAAYEYFS